MLLRLSLAATAALLLAAAPALAKTKNTTPADQVACAGVYGADSTEALVKEAFGAQNVVTGTVPGPEGTELIATTVFPDDPQKTMQFFWFDEENFTHLSSVRLAPARPGPWACASA